MKNGIHGILRGQFSMAIGNNSSSTIVTEWVIDNKKYIAGVKEQAKEIRAYEKHQKEVALVEKYANKTRDELTKSTNSLNRATQQLSNQQQNLGKALSLSIAKGTALVGGIIALGKGFYEATKEVQEYSNASSVFQGNIDKSIAATKGLASALDVMNSKNRLNTLGVQLSDEQYESLLKNLTKISSAMNIDMGFALDSATTMLARQSTAVADNIGVVITADIAYQKYASTLGKTVNQLTASEKKLAFQTEALEQLSKKAEELPEKQLTALDSLKVAWNSFGNTVMKVMSGINRDLGKMFNGVEGVNSALLRSDKLSKDITAKKYDVETFQKKIEDLEKKRAELANAKPLLSATADQFNKNVAERLAMIDKEIYKYQSLERQARDSIINIKNERKDALDYEKKYSKQIELEKGYKEDELAVSLFGNIGQSTFQYSVSSKEEKKSGKSSKSNKPKEILNPASYSTETDSSWKNTAEKGMIEDPDVQRLANTIIDEKRVQIEKLKNAYDNLSESMRNNISWAKEEVDYTTTLGTVYNQTNVILKDFSESALDKFSEAMYDSITATIDGTASFGKAMKDMTSIMLQELAREAGVLAIKETAMGLGSLAVFNFPSAANHFAAAGLWTGLALGSGVGAYAISGKVSAPGTYGAREHKDNERRKNYNQPSSPSIGTKKDKDDRPIYVSVFFSDPMNPSAMLIANKQAQYQISRA